jgi:hypothetical protein
MRIYVLGSTHFKVRMVECKEELCALGYDGWIHPHYEEFVRGERKEQLSRWMEGDPTELARIKRENNYLHDHYKHILESDAILVVNEEKNGISNYIGGNVLMEMGQAYVNHKKIFLLNGMPKELSYVAEIETMDPICLNGELSNIS